MTDSPQSPAFRYVAPAAPEGCQPSYLVAGRGTAGEQRFAFYADIELGRDDGRTGAIGVVLVADPTVSRRHCIISRRSDGRCFIRDLSRNGTRLDGRRLVPNIEMEVRPGQVVALADGLEFVIEGEEAPRAKIPEPTGGATIVRPANAVATLLVGDIRDYTVLVRRAPSSVLQQSVSLVFERLTEVVGELGGTVKEYQGDALVAFWEGNFSGAHVAKACRAALELDRLAQQLAHDRTVWQVEDFELRMDWALATGAVVIDTFGGSQPTGLSMIGEPIVLAFRLEKFANDEVGRILACRVTRELAGPTFRFRDLGEMTAKGFDQPDRVFALEGENP